MALKKICAWCQAELGEVESPSSGITHGICPTCRFRVEQQFPLRVEHLEASLALENDVHILRLKEGERVVALFTIQAEGDAILREADKYLPYQPA
jgi:hypothetical protein